VTPTSTRIHGGAFPLAEARGTMAITHIAAQKTSSRVRPQKAL